MSSRYDRVSREMKVVVVEEDGDALCALHVQRGAMRQSEKSGAVPRETRAASALLVWSEERERDGTVRAKCANNRYLHVSCVCEL